MKRRVGSAVTAIAVLGFLGGCATQVSPSDPIYTKVNALQTQVKQMRRKIEGQGLMQMASQQQQIESELTSLQGQLQQLQHELAQDTKQQQSVNQSFDHRLSVLEQGVSAVGVHLQAQSEGQSAQSAAQSTSASASASSSANTGQSSQTGGPGADYNSAFNQLKNGNYSRAVAGFQKLISKYPKSRYVPSAWYWMGETHYVNGEYKKAISNFQQVLTNFAKSEKAPEAYLKIGYAQYALKQYGQAKQTFQAVVTRYPNSTAADLAKQRLARMNSQGN